MKKMDICDWCHCIVFNSLRALYLKKDFRKFQSPYCLWSWTCALKPASFVRCFEIPSLSRLDHKGDMANDFHSALAPKLLLKAVCTYFTYQISTQVHFSNWGKQLMRRVSLEEIADVPWLHVTELSLGFELPPRFVGSQFSWKHHHTQLHFPPSSLLRFRRLNSLRSNSSSALFSLSNSRGWVQIDEVELGRSQTWLLYP
jgi:hypothetical protein